MIEGKEDSVLMQFCLEEGRTPYNLTCPAIGDLTWTHDLYSKDPGTEAAPPSWPQSLSEKGSFRVTLVYALLGMASLPGQHCGGPDASGATLTIDLPKVRKMVSLFTPFQAPAGSPSGRRQEFGRVYGSPMELQPNRSGGLRSLMLLFSSGKYIKSHPCPTSTPTVFQIQCMYKMQKQSNIHS